MEKERERGVGRERAKEREREKDVPWGSMFRASGAGFASQQIFFHRTYLLNSFGDSTPPQNRHLIVYYC